MFDTAHNQCTSPTGISSLTTSSIRGQRNSCCTCCPLLLNHSALLLPQFHRYLSITIPDSILDFEGRRSLGEPVEVEIFALPLLNC